MAKAPWTDVAVLKAVREYALAAIEEHGPIQLSIVDDTGIPRKEQHSVEVARQYCGQLGKPDNCRVAVTLALANDAASLPIAYQLYLPKPWVSDRAQGQSRGARGDKVSHQARDRPGADHGGGRTGRARGVVLADAGYGNDSKFREGLTALGVEYICHRLPANPDPSFLT